MPKAPKDGAHKKKNKGKGKAADGKKSSKRRDRVDCSSQDDAIGGIGSSASTDSSSQSAECGLRKKSRAAGAMAVSAPASPLSRADAMASGPMPAASTPAAADTNQHAVVDPTAATADKSASKRARADALVARLNTKLHSTTDAKKRLKLQAKMLRLLTKCTPSQVQPRPPAPVQPSKRTLSAGAAGAGPTFGSSSGGGGGLCAGFHFKLQRTPKAALPPAPQPTGPEEDARRRLRQQRFGDAGVGVAQAGDEKADAVLAESGGYGTNEALEKEYLRLTSLPRASDVRPPAVLAVALRLVKAKWLQRPDYAAASEQLKAIRQDLTVQHVRDGLTVDVYETHGRLALEADDLAEFRRCHGVLRQLYSEELPGNPAEFEAYGLLYTQATAAARNTLAMELSRVPPHLLDHPFVRHAMDVCAATRSGNYARFIALYDGAPRMSPYIMDRLLGQMRLCALQSTVAAYKPLPVPLAHLAAQMGLETEDEATELAELNGAQVDRAGRCLDTKASAVQPLGPSRPPA